MQITILHFLDPCNVLMRDTAVERQLASGLGGLASGLWGGGGEDSTAPYRTWSIKIQLAPNIARVPVSKTVKGKRI